MNDNRKFGEPARPAAPDSTPRIHSASVTRVDAQSLLGTAREVILALQGNEYRLRLAGLAQHEP